MLAVVAGFAVTSCKNDDEETPLIVGTWKLNKTVINYANGTSNIETPNSCEAKTEIIFNADNSLISNEYYNSGSSCVLDDATGNYSYNQSASKVSITLDGTTDDFNILSLTTSELVIRGQDDDYDGDGNNDQFIVHLKK